jgi:DNA-binding CsgD family transcriptional regulator
VRVPNEWGGGQQAACLAGREAGGRPRGTPALRRNGLRGEVDTDRELLFAVYREVLTDPRWSPAGLSQSLGVSEERLEAAVRVLLELGWLTESGSPGSGVSASSPEAALSRVLAAEERSAERRLADIHFVSDTVRRLVDELTAQQSRRVNLAHAEVLTGPDEVGTALEDAALMVRYEVLSMHPGPVLDADSLTDGLRRDKEALSRGVSMRSIHLAAMTRTPHAAAHLDTLRSSGAQVRLAPVVPFRLIIIDDSLAFTGGGDDRGGVSALVTRGPAIIQLLRKVFEFCWLSATPMFPPGIGDPVELSEQQRWILRMLDTGAKDEAVARELGVSVRTFRRLMADLMQKLEVTSRFQAGAQARRRGYLR